MAEDDERRLDSDELRTRAVYGAVALTVATAVFVFIDVAAAEWLAIPAGIVHFVVLLTYVAACSLLLHVFFRLRRFLRGPRSLRPLRRLASPRALADRLADAAVAVGRSVSFSTG